MEGTRETSGSTPHLVGKEAEDAEREREPQVTQRVSPGRGGIK